MNLVTVPLSGQPDMLCDLLAAGIADEYLRRDPESRVCISVSGGRGALFVSGETISTADFDVTHTIQRLLGQHGIHDGMEPFVSIEPVSSQQVAVFREPCLAPILGFGYATRENEQRMPRAYVAANALVKALVDKRLEDPEWFWLGSAGTVQIVERSGETGATVTVEHGTRALDKVRNDIKGLATSLPELSGIGIYVNPLGPIESAGLTVRMGTSGKAWAPYGSAMPSVANVAGLGWHDARFLATAMARMAAKFALGRSSSKAVFVRLAYGAGERRPSGIWAKDERGQDVTPAAREAILDLDQACQVWTRPGLMTEAVKSQMVGDRNLPWE